MTKKKDPFPRIINRGQGYTPIYGSIDPKNPPRGGSAVIPVKISEHQNKKHS